MPDKNTPIPVVPINDVQFDAQGNLTVPVAYSAQDVQDRISEIQQRRDNLASQLRVYQGNIDRIQDEDSSLQKESNFLISISLSKNASLATPVTLTP